MLYPNYKGQGLYLPTLACGVYSNPLGVTLDVDLIRSHDTGLRARHQALNIAGRYGIAVSIACLAAYCHTVLAHTTLLATGFRHQVG